MTSGFGGKDIWLIYNADLKVETNFDLNVSSLYQATLVDDKLFLVTSSGIFVSSSLRGCWFAESFHCGIVC